MISITVTIQTSCKKLERSNNDFSSYHVNKNFFASLTLTFDMSLSEKICRRGRMYEFDLLHHVGVVAKRLRGSKGLPHWAHDVVAT